MSLNDEKPAAGTDSPHLANDEREQAATSKLVAARVIHEVLREEGEIELRRPLGALLWSGLAYSHAHALLQRQLDLIVTSDPMEDMDKLVRRPLFTEPFVAVLPGTRRARYTTPADLPALAQDFPLVRFSTRSHYGAITERYLRRRGISAKRHLEIDASDVLMAGCLGPSISAER